MNEAKNPDVSLMYLTSRAGRTAKIPASEGKKNEIITSRAPLIKSRDKIGKTKMLAIGEISEKLPK